MTQRISMFLLAQTVVLRGLKDIKAKPILLVERIVAANVLLQVAQAVPIRVVVRVDVAQRAPIAKHWRDGCLCPLCDGGPRQALLPSSADCPTPCL